MVWLRGIGAPAQMRRIRPGTSRRRWARTPTTASAVMARSWQRQDRGPAGEMALSAASWSRVDPAATIGVGPTGASGRTTLGRGATPEAAIKRSGGGGAAALF
jgi:hypothetical protein